MKPVEFAGTALDDLRAFPETARREAGYQIDKVQCLDHLVHIKIVSSERYDAAGLTVT